MGLDIRTVVVMFGMLSLMFAGLLELAGLRIGVVRGVRQLAVANLCISLGLFMAFIYTYPVVGQTWAVVFGATLVGMGIIIQLMGIHAFKEAPSQWQAKILAIGIIFGLNLWFSVIHPDVSARAIANSVVFAIVYALCAKALLIKIDAPLKSSYWFTGVCFSALCLLMIIRGVVIWETPLDANGLFFKTPINAFAFTMSCLLQFAATFGFLLMLNDRLVNDIHKIASRDALTGAFNRRRLEEEATRLKARCLRTGETLAIMMVDIDYFKTVNDRYGHPVGDEVLRCFARMSLDTIRPDDYFARYGGEEFCILLHDSNESEAMELAERLRRVYQEASTVIGDVTVKITVSFGVADSTQVGLEFDALVAAADQALYQAKKTGRNRVVAYSDLSK